MVKLNVVVLSDYQDIFNQFQNAIDTYEPECMKTLVKSYETDICINNPATWVVMDAPKHFIFARNANLGINVDSDADILLTNDDVQLTRPNTLSDLVTAAYSSEDIGILSPVIDGGVGNPLQKFHGVEEDKIVVSTQRLAFVCVYIKRSTINKVGLLDEDFDGYGGDDVDYSMRTQKAGLKLAVTNKVCVKHGFDKTTASSSFTRTMGDTYFSMARMNHLVKKKHGVKDLNL